MTRVARSPVLPVISVNAQSRTYLDDRGDGHSVPELTWRDRQFIEQLGRGRLEIRELRTGLEIVAKAHVGYIPFEHFALRIHPAISHLDMLRMMHYAYEIDDLRAYDRTGVTATMEFAPEELVIAALAFHVRKLVRRGLFQAYVGEDTELATVRGSIRFAELASRSRMSVALPCRYERRTADVLLNQILLGGLVRAQQLTTNRRLLRELAPLRTFLEEYVTPIPLTETAFRTAERQLTRLSAHYRPALDLCYLLYEQASLGGAVEGSRHFPGFLLNMNHLFERFIGRLLEEIVPRGYRVDKQSRRAFYTAPPGQPTPHLRPDFRILDSRGQVSGIVDAKYKFLDGESIDVSDLYQLTIYGMADEPIRGSVIALYPGSHNVDSFPDSNYLRGNNRTYSFEGPNRRRLTVIFRRLDLGRVWETLKLLDGKARLYHDLVMC